MNEAARRPATTDADGRFRINGLASESIVTLQIEEKDVALNTIQVVSRVVDPIPAPGIPNEYGPGTTTIYGADFTYSASPGRAVEGVLKDAKTGQPLADAEVRSYRFAGSDFVGTMNLRTRSDAQGRFRLASFPKGKTNLLLIVPNDNQPYLLQEVTLPDPPGVGAVAVEVPMNRGLWIEGKITEQATGQPVAGAWMHYLPFRDNTFAQANPVFHKHGNTDGTGLQDRYKSQADGTFRLVGLPGRAIVGAVAQKGNYVQGAGSESIAGLTKQGHFLTYNNPISPGKLWPTALREINPTADAEVVHLDFALTTGPSVRLTVTDADGQPVTGAWTHGANGQSSAEGEAMTTPARDIRNLMPNEERLVWISHKERRIGKVLRVRQGDDIQAPVPVMLEPFARLTGRVLDVDGHPMPAAQVRADLLPGGDFSLSLPKVLTDEQGRFTLPDVAVGCDYALAIETGVSIKDRQYTFLEKAIVRPGETTDVGDIRFKKD